MRTRNVIAGLLGIALVGTATVAIAAGDPPPRIAFVARSDNPADALAAGPIAGQLGAPLFTTPPTSLAPEAQAGLGEYGPDLVIITGGEGAVSVDVERSIETALGLPDDMVIRASGANRHATAAAIVDLLGTYNPAWLGIGGTSADTDAVGGTPAEDVVTTGPVEITTSDWYPGYPSDQPGTSPEIKVLRYGGLTRVEVDASASSSHVVKTVVSPSLPGHLFGRPMQLVGLRHCQDIVDSGLVEVDRRNLNVFHWGDERDGSHAISEDTSLEDESIASASSPMCVDWLFDPIPLDDSTGVALELLTTFALSDEDQRMDLGPVTFYLEPAA